MTLGVAGVSALVIAALYFGRDLFIPFALAILLTFLLTPLSSWIERLHLDRRLAAVIVLLFVFLFVGSAAWLGVSQIADIADKIPQYRNNIRRKIEWLNKPGGTAFAKLIENVQQIGNDVTPETASEPSQRRTAGDGQVETAPSQKPVVVEVVRRNPGVFEVLGTFSSPVTRSLAEIGAVLVFTLFMLIRRCDLRDRLLRLLGIAHLQKATSALDDAANRISRYVIAQCFANAMFGLALGLGLYFIGLPNAGFWGIAGAILRFIPYLGPLIAGGCPLILAVAVFDGWYKTLGVFALFASVESVLTGFLEPWFYGAHTGLSSIAILLSASFWAVLWGPVGLVLSMPLTVCLLVLGRYAPSLRFLNVILGDEPVLEPYMAFYQRLLALDEIEARGVVKAFQEGRSLLDLYDAVFLPGLVLAEQDRHQKTLGEDQIEFIQETIRSFIDEGEAGKSRVDPDQQNRQNPQLSILCVAARDAADELAAVMLAQVLRRYGLHATVQPFEASEDLISLVKKQQPYIVMVSSLPPYALNRARRVCKGIREECPQIKLILGYWDTAADSAAILDRLGGCFESVATSLEMAKDCAIALTAAPDMEKDRLPVTSNGRL